MDIQSFLASVQQNFGASAPAVNTLILSVLLLLAGFILGKIAGKFINWILKQVDADYYAKKHVGIRFSLTSALSAIVSGAIYLFTIYYTVQTLQITKIVIIVALSLIGLFILLSFIGIISNLLPNAIAWIRIRSSEEIMIGKTFSFGRITGKVEGQNLLFTTITTPEKEMVVIPHVLLKKRLARRR